MSEDLINHPKHYESQAIKLEPIDFCELLPFNPGNALKYCFRAGHKKGASEWTDLQKALFYAERFREKVENDNALSGRETRLDEFFVLSPFLAKGSSIVLQNIDWGMVRDPLTFATELSESIGNRLADIEPEEEERKAGKPKTAIPRIALFYGKEHQLRKLKEECVELMEALDGFLAEDEPYEHVIEEMADVAILLKQLKWFMHEDQRREYDRVVTFKLARQVKRIDEGRAYD